MNGAKYDENSPHRTSIQLWLGRVDDIEQPTVKCSKSVHDKDLSSGMVKGSLTKKLSFEKFLSLVLAQEKVSNFHLLTYLYFRHDLPFAIVRHDHFVESSNGRLLGKIELRVADQRMLW